ncbi:MAG TPA: hypothetical protein VK480_09730 [Solirubrobacterales bacterium]|nr:hypothetical protein [Solirubrobacterales bacterium]
MSRAGWLVAGLVVAALLLASGCGGGGDDTTASLTKDEFVKQANAICTKHQRQMEAKFSKFVEEANAGSRTSTPEKFKEGVTKIAIPALEEQIEELSALPAPAGEEEQVKLILERQEETLKKVEADPTFRTSGGPYEELNKPASDYGLSECAV